MPEASGAAFIPIYKKLKNPAEAPKPFMLAMASDDAQLHVFLTRIEAETFALGILKAICDT